MFHAFRVALAALTLSALAACGGGGDTATENHTPAARIVAAGEVRTDGAAVLATRGGAVQLDAGQSTDADGDPLTYAWTFDGRPDSSKAALSKTEGSHTTFQPDVLGEYAITLDVTDAKGGRSSQQIVVRADNTAPSSNVTVMVAFTPVPTDATPQSLTVGSTLALDASKSKDPDGDVVTTTFALVAKPSGSQAALSVTGGVARLTTDVAGSYRLRATGSDGKGGSFIVNYTFAADNRAPNPIVVADVKPNVADAGASSAQVAVGYDVVLNASGSKDPDGDGMTYAWQLASRPAGSLAVLGSATGGASAITPDLLGEYVVMLTATDAKGAQSRYTFTVKADNRRPVANIGSNATPQAQAAAPDIHVPLGTTVTLRGSLSTDADGDDLSYLWSLQSHPNSSVATLSSTTAADPEFTADKNGSYWFRLRVTDAAGAYSERSVRLVVGGHAPVALVDVSNASAIVGETLHVSSGLSFDADQDALTYQWSVDARPAGSTAAIAAPTDAVLAFTPDVTGTYVIALRVSDGQSTGITYVSIRALASLSDAVSLSFRPDDARYSRSLDRIVAVSTNPNAVRVIDPFGGSVQNVPLPLAVKNFSLSPDGKLAVVLHEGSFSLVDLQTPSLVRTTASGGSQTDAFVTDAALVFLIGQSGGQWVDEGFVTFNGRSGAKLGSAGAGAFYGTQTGVQADRLDKVFLMEQGISPSDIKEITFDPATGAALGFGESPYHGDYDMGATLYLTENQDLVITSAGTYFATSDLRYAGALAGVYGIESFSHSSAAEEALVLRRGSGYPDRYKRFTGSLFLPQADMTLPQIGGAQSYGIKVFHSATGRHVLIVQTGSDQPGDAGASYHVLVR